MKICVCSQLKNDGDIIESFCRYHFTYADHIIVTDDRSVDNTVDIVKALIEEGLPVTLIQIPHDTPILRGPDLHFAQNMYDIAFDAMGMDWVLGLDVDEFLCCKDGSNPRVELEALSNDVEYHLYWQTSIYRQDPVDNAVFLPTYFSEYRDPMLESYHKTLLSRHLATQWGARYAQGKHDLHIPNRKHRKAVRKEKHQSLLLAHFPLRSVPQTIVKIANGWHKYQYYGAWDGSGFHWKDIYNYLSLHDTLRPEQIRSLSKEYALNDEQKQQPIQTVPHPFGALRLDFLNKPIQMRHTNYKANANYMNPVLAYYELLLENLRRNTAGENKLQNCRSTRKVSPATDIETRS